jgi:hypothetical protein
MSWLPPWSALLLFTFTPPAAERADLIEAYDEADLIDQARIEEALHDTTSRAGLRLLEQEIRDRRDRHFRKEHSRAIGAGLRFNLVQEEALHRQAVGYLALLTVDVSFDLLVGEIRPGPVLPPISESVRLERCLRLAEESSEEREGVHDRLLRTIELRERVAALGCAATDEGAP